MSTRVSYSFLDKIIMVADEGLRTLLGSAPPSRENPGSLIPNPILLPSERKQSGAQMRVNHVGEVCAQALYIGQSLVARTQRTEDMLKSAAQEETDHLAWCKQRLYELDAHQSYLNLVWFLGALVIGIGAGWMGDKWSLGFVAETESQVEQHLQHSMHKLPKADLKSRVILQQMTEDEIHHGTVAKNSGAAELPYLIKTLMTYFAKIMTTTAYWV